MSFALSRCSWCRKCPHLGRPPSPGSARREQMESGPTRAPPPGRVRHSSKWRDRISPRLTATEASGRPSVTAAVRLIRDPPCGHHRHRDSRGHVRVDDWPHSVARTPTTPTRALAANAAPAPVVPQAPTMTCSSPTLQGDTGVVSPQDHQRPGPADVPDPSVSRASILLRVHPQHC